MTITALLPKAKVQVRAGSDFNRKSPDSFFRDCKIIAKGRYRVEDVMEKYYRDETPYLDFVNLFFASAGPTHNQALELLERVKEFLSENGPVSFPNTGTVLDLLEHAARMRNLVRVDILTNPDREESGLSDLRHTLATIARYDEFLMAEANRRSTAYADESKWEYRGPRAVYQKSADGSTKLIPLPEQVWEPGTPESILDQEWIADEDALDLAKFYIQTESERRLTDAKLMSGFDGQRRCALIVCRDLLTALCAMWWRDRGRGVEFRECRNARCKKIYKLAAQTGKVYCTPECEHRDRSKRDYRKKRFFQLREKGWKLERISRKLDVPKDRLVQWETTLKVSKPTKRKKGEKP